MVVGAPARVGDRNGCVGLRVVYVTASYPSGSGEAFVAPELRALLDLGHDVRVAPVHPRGAKVQNDGPFQQRTWSATLFPGGLNRARQRVARARQMRSLPPLISLNRPRVTAKNLAVVAKGLWLAERAKEWNAEHIHAFWSSTPATVAWVASKATGIPWSFTVHRWDLYENNLIRQKLAEACFGRAISALGLRELEGLASNGSSARLLHVGVDLPESIPTLRIPPSPPKLLMPALLVPVKGHAIFLQAMAKIRRSGIEIGATCAGDGPLRARLVAETTRLGLQSCIDFPGMIPHRELLQRMWSGEWTAVVLASLSARRGQHEGIPVSLMEAMAARLPVIATRSGSVEELVTDDVGFLATPGDARELAKVIQALVASADQGAAMGIHGHERVLTHFDARKIARELSSLFSACSEAGSA
jgi:colanic acid/amylovoran biosynthesis glycosyltransferase